MKERERQRLIERVGQRKRERETKIDRERGKERENKEKLRVIFTNA